MRILFLDDDEQRHTEAQRQLIGHDVTYVRDAMEPLAVLVHSYNNQGAMRMIACLQAGEIQAWYIPFGPGLFKAVKSAFVTGESFSG